MREKSELEKYIVGENTKIDPVKGPESAFAAALSPKNDFLPGSMLSAYPEALEAAKTVVDKAIKTLCRSASIVWRGTIASVHSKDGKLLDRVEIHGASYDREHDEASGVRFDITGLKSKLDK